MQNNRHTRLHAIALAITSALMLTACGGGGGGSTETADGSGSQSDGGGSSGAAGVISGSTTGTTAEGSTNAVSGTLSYSAPASGGAQFTRPASLAGLYGSFTLNETTGAWTYQVDNTKAETIALATGQTVFDTLKVTSVDGATSATIAITINGLTSTPTNTVGIPIVTSVAAASYPSTAPFASDKLAVFNRLNDDRSRCGFGKVAQSTLLDKAAQAHSDYLARNQLGNDHLENSSLPGFTGVDPGNRATAAGYSFSYVAEILHQGEWGSIFSTGININNRPVQEFKATNLLLDMYASIYHLSGAMSHTTEVGIGVSGYAISNGTLNKKILNIDFGVPSTLSQFGQQIDKGQIVTFPCEGATGIFPRFGPEAPDPFPGVDLRSTPYGQPIYARGTQGSAVKITSGTVKPRGGANLPVVIFDSTNDPNKVIQGHEAFLVPTTRMADNTTYDVILNGTLDGAAFTKSFSFVTGTQNSE